MKPSKASLVLAVGACILMALLASFAFELANTQAKSRADVEQQVRQRGELAAALINSLFQSVQQDVPQDSRIYGGRTVSDRVLDAAAQGSEYLVLIGPAPGHPVLAASGGFTAHDRAVLPRSAALSLVYAGRPYGLGNYSGLGRRGVVDFAVAFPTRYGTRILLSGFNPAALTPLIDGELNNIPGPRGSYNYLVDGAGVVLASTNSAAPVGQRISQPGAIQSLRRGQVDLGRTFFTQVALANSTWRLVLAAPDGPLFASVNGLRQSVPWVIFAAFALVALLALLFGWRTLGAADQLASANAKLEGLNSDLLAANAALERRAAELARSNEELDHFASIASHDLQEPLRKVRTFTEQLCVMEADRLSEKGRDYLHRANRSAERMQTLIDDLLKFSRVSTQGRAFETVDLNEVFRDVIQDLELQTSAYGAVVQVDELPTVSADPVQMQQLALNLLSNALKFRREGVVPEIRVCASVDQDVVTLRVSDNGIGIDPRYTQRIFRIFERLHGRNEYPGTGIGLALCRKIADRHGGMIAAESEPGVGTTFVVTLSHTGGTLGPPATRERRERAVGRKRAHAGV